LRGGGGHLLLNASKGGGGQQGGALAEGLLSPGKDPPSLSPREHCVLADRLDFYPIQGECVDGRLRFSKPVFGIER